MVFLLIFRDAPGYKQQKGGDSMLALINIDSKGYGKIYKSVMRDRNLPLLAKTIYAYFASFAGGGTTAFPRRTTIRNGSVCCGARPI